MFKPSIKNIVFFFFFKYFLFYIFMMLKNKDYTLIDISSLRNSEDFFFYLWLFLFLPVVCSVLFAGLIFFAFKTRSTFYLILLLIVFLIAEYFLYIYFASQADMMNGVYNGIISLFLLILFFFRNFSLVSKQRI